MSSREKSIRKEVGNGTVRSFLVTALQAASIQAAAQSQQPVTKRRDHANDRHPVADETGAATIALCLPETRDREGSGESVTVKKSQLGTWSKKVGLLWSTLKTCWASGRLHWTFLAQEAPSLGKPHTSRMNLKTSSMCTLLHRGFKAAKSSFQQNMLLLRCLHGYPFMVDVGGIKTWPRNV